MTSTWWISVPDWTIQVTHRDGLMVAIAPCMARRWYGRRFGDLTAWVRRTFPGQWHAQRLNQERRVM